MLIKSCKRLAVFLVAPLAWSNGQTVNLIPRVFPERPASDDDYTEISTHYTSGTFTVPEDGWYKVVVTGKGYDGEYGTKPPKGEPRYNVVSMSYAYSSEGGQAGGAAVSIFAFHAGEEYTYTISGSSSSFLDMRGNGVSASGGNLANYTGNPGSPRNSGSISAHSSSYKDYVAGGAGGQGPSPFNPAGGRGSAVVASSWNSKEENFGTVKQGEPGKAAANYVRFYRGNTNLTQAQLNAMDITTLMLDNSRLEQEVTGIMLSQSAQ